MVTSTDKIAAIALALLLASATAAAQTRIKTAGITDEAVTTAKIADNAVTTGKVALDTLTAADLAPDSVGTSELADGTVAAGDLAATLDLSGKTVTLPATNQSRIVQVVNTQTGAVATGTTTVPYDDTIPQNTEGDEYMTLTITPTSATNKLQIDVVLFGTISTNNPLSVALFQDSTAGALAAAAHPVVSGGMPVTIKFTHYMTAGTTSATTFKVRAGAGAAATTTFNGASGARRFGGVASSSITITEIRN